MVSLQQIQAYADEVARRFKPAKIILFGSYAYGRPTPDSDVDLLVVMTHTGRSPYQATRIRNTVRAPFALDLLVRSPQRLHQRLQVNDWFLREIADRGRVLYES